MTTPLITSSPDLLTHSPDGESRGRLMRVGDLFPLDPTGHLRSGSYERASAVRPWGLRFLRVPLPRAGKHEGPTARTSGGDGTGPEETSSD